MSKLAIVIVAFNRPDSLNRLLNSLKDIIVDKDDKITLHISIDKKENDKSNEMTINIANNYIWDYGDKVVDVKEENYGLKRHVLYCGNLTNKYENIIVLEDDILVSPLIVNYSKQVLDYYSNDSLIAGFGLYSFQRNPLNGYPFFPLNNGSDVYFMQYACSWGQLWTKKRWNAFYNWYLENKDNNFNDNEKIPNYIKNWGDKSWLKYHIYYCILNDKYFVYPLNGLTTNFTDSGTHNSIVTNAYQCNLIVNNKNMDFKFISIKDSLNIYDAYFENKKISKILKYEEDIDSDVYGSKKYFCSKRVLSTKKYNYKILRSYALEMYPYELNLLYNIKGNNLFLYDTSKMEKNNYKDNNYDVLKYYFKLEQISSKNIIQIIKNFIFELFKRIVNRRKK